jgi:mannose-1-phosphate guanylyltransferase / mannose-6-phosphate isomerase
MTSFTPVILSGGSGTRLWPLSRAGFPKQFLCLTGDTSLFQQAMQRLVSLPGAQAPIVVCNEDHRFLVQGQLEELARLEPSSAGLLQQARLLLEPVGRNTAPAMTLAALACESDALLVVTPADQTVADSKAFGNAIAEAVREAAGDALVTLGITPDRAETGYGYIRAAKRVAGDAGGSTSSGGSAGLSGAGGADACRALTVEGFVEKPTTEKARAYLLSGDYFWNAGMFVAKALVWQRALQTHRPDMAQTCEAAWAMATTDSIKAGGHSLSFIRPDRALFEAIASESIDYAVMEPSPGGAIAVKVVPFNGGWNDLGAWDAVWKSLEKDAKGNAQYGDVLTQDCENTLAHANHRLVSLVGVKDVVVVETADAVLVTHHDQSQSVKAIVDALKARGREEQTLHRKVHRPWGWYDSIDEGERFKVKRIQVKPGAALSLQKHHHRAEHWIVVKGTAEITIGEKVVLLSENQSTYIPLGETHRLANPGTIPLEIIEVQSGSYLGEDDIVRFEDQYGR